MTAMRHAGIQGRWLRRPAALMLVAGLAGWVLAAAVVAMGSSPASGAGELRNLEMVIVYPVAGSWEVVRISMLIEDDGSDLASVAVAARAERLARFPGGVELDPEVSGQYELQGWKLEARSATWFYNPDDAPRKVEATGYAAFQGGAAAWNYAADTDFHFIEGGLTDRELSVCLGDGRDGQNTVGWRTLQGPVLAEACSVMTEGEPQEFDLQFSSAAAWTTDPNGVNIDLQSVAIHEFGHALGLKHSKVSGSVMFSGYKRGTLLREPTADDLAGLRELYGPGAATPTATPPAVQELLPRGVVPGLSRQ